MSFFIGGEGEIRTLEPLLAVTRFPVVRARPTTRLLQVRLFDGNKRIIPQKKWLVNTKIKIFSKKIVVKSGEKQKSGEIILPKFLKNLLTRCQKSGILTKYSLSRCGGIGRRHGLKIRWEEIPVPVQVRSSAPLISRGRAVGSSSGS